MKYEIFCRISVCRWIDVISLIYYEGDGVCDVMQCDVMFDTISDAIRFDVTRCDEMRCDGMCDAMRFDAM